MTSDEAIDVLRAVLQRMRSDKQGGYLGYLGDGKWAFISVGLPQVTPDELNALLALAGIVPDEIQPRGACTTCRFAVDGRERGWLAPCVSCSRPRMSNYKRRRKAHAPRAR